MLSAERRADVLEAKEATYREALGALEATVGVTELLDFADARGLPLRGRHQRPARQCRDGARGARADCPAADPGHRLGAAALET